MSALVFSVGFVIVASIVNFAIKAVLYRIKNGRFRVVWGTGEKASSGFVSDYGSFVFSPTRSMLFYSGEAGPKLDFRVSDINAVTVRVAQNSSLLGELVFGLDLWDLFGTYRDSVDWRVVLLEMSDGVQIPAFIAGQYVRRELALGWWFDWEKRVLERLGLFKAVEDRSWEVAHEIEGLIREQGGLR